MTDLLESEAEALARMERALRRMPRLDREIFLAVRLDDMKYHDVAARTGLSVRQIERRVAWVISTLDRDLHGDPLVWWRRWLGQSADLVRFGGARLAGLRDLARKDR